MPDQRDAPHLLEMAEHAAIAGDFSTADELLKEAARLQEAELGPLHPDLANTLTNLAIVAEKTGRNSEAETFYRRAADIAARSLPKDHSAVLESRKNLENFCAEHSVPVELERRSGSSDPPAIDAPLQGRSDQPPVKLRQSTDQPPQKLRRSAEASAKADALRAKAEDPPRQDSSMQLLLAFAAIVLMAVLLLVWRPWSPDQASAVAAPDPAPARQPAQPPAVLPPPVPASPSSKPAAKDDDRGVAPGNRSSNAGGVSLVTAQVCQAFSASGERWQCDPVGDAAEPGRLALYTRVKSSDDATIEHRWYRGDTLRQAVKLNVRANTSEGYRTYSRQTVNPGDTWRVEVRNAHGDVLHETRFAVR